MRRLRVLLATTLLGSVLAGCTSPALEEGMGKGQVDPDAEARMKKIMQLQQTTAGGEKKAAAKLKDMGVTKPAP